MKDFAVYEHIHGLPSSLDSVNEEITDCAMEYCHTRNGVEKFVEEINAKNDCDKYGRKRNLYVYWF